jgi:hypothetical protein
VCAVPWVVVAYQTAFQLRETDVPNAAESVKERYVVFGMPELAPLIAEAQAAATRALEGARRCEDRRRLGATFGRLRLKGESTDVTFASLLRDHQPLFERGEPLGDHQKRHGGQRKRLCLHLEQLVVTLMVLFLTFRCL